MRFPSHRSGTLSNLMPSETISVGMSASMRVWPNVHTNGAIAVATKLGPTAVRKSATSDREDRNNWKKLPSPLVAADADGAWVHVRCSESARSANVTQKLIARHSGQKRSRDGAQRKLIGAAFQMKMIKIPA